MEPGKHNRITEILYDAWDKARGTRVFPEPDDIDKSIISEVWDDSFIIKIIPLISEYGFSFEYRGKNLSPEHIHSETGLYIKNLITGFLETETERYTKVVKSKKPLIEENIYKAANGGVIKYRQILLPLGNTNKDEACVEKIIGGMRFLIEHSTSED
ncbi:hypothetical protein N9W34_02980 [Rickettsiales bacterium]|nr:hypothetical protein [Rickettsiales bacterium]